MGELYWDSMLGGYAISERTSMTGSHSRLATAADLGSYLRAAERRIEMLLEHIPVPRVKVVSRAQLDEGFLKPDPAVAGGMRTCPYSVIKMIGEDQFLVADESEGGSHAG